MGLNKLTFKFLIFALCAGSGSFAEVNIHKNIIPFKIAALTRPDNGFYQLIIETDSSGKSRIQIDNLPDKMQGVLQLSYSEGIFDPETNTIETKAAPFDFKGETWKVSLIKNKTEYEIKSLEINRKYILQDKFHGKDRAIISFKDGALTGGTFVKYIPELYNSNQIFEKTIWKFSYTKIGKHTVLEHESIEKIEAELNPNSKLTKREQKESTYYQLNFDPYESGTFSSKSYSAEGIRGSEINFGFTKDNRQISGTVKASGKTLADDFDKAMNNKANRTEDYLCKRYQCVIKK